MTSRPSHKFTAWDLAIIEEAMRDYSRRFRFDSSKLAQEQYEELLDKVKHAAGGRLYFEKGD